MFGPPEGEGLRDGGQDNVVNVRIDRACVGVRMSGVQLFARTKYEFTERGYNENHKGNNLGGGVFNGLVCRLRCFAKYAKAEGKS